MLMVVGRCPRKDMRDVLQFLLQEAAMFMKDMAVTFPITSPSSSIYSRSDRRYFVAKLNTAVNDFLFDCREGHALEDSCYESGAELLLRSSATQGASSGQCDDNHEQFHASSPVNAGMATQSG